MVDRLVKILLLDDNAAEARFTAQALRRSGHSQLYRCYRDLSRLEITHRMTIASALKKGQKLRYDLILVSLDLISRYGHEFVSEFMAFFRNMPIIILTTLDRQEDALQVVTEGAQDCLFKEELGNISIIRNLFYAIERHQNLAQLRQQYFNEKKQTSSRNQFLAQMSHEIRTPMNGIIGLISVLRENQNLPEDVKQNLSTIHKSSQSLIQIINDILEISKIESGTVEIINQDLDIRELIDDCLLTLAHAAKAKGLMLLSSFDPKVPRFVKSDPHRIRQILTNLISNAIKFTEHGYIWIHASPEQDTGYQKRLRIEVKDTGRGLSMDQQKRLFVAYQQARAEDQKQGTGLGLSICKSLVDLLEGEIGVESRESKGSNFWFSLCDHGAAQKRPNSWPSIAHKRVIGIFSNSCRYQFIIKSILTMKKIDCTIVDSPSAMRQELAQNHYDLILFDQADPGNDLKTLQSQIRKLGKKFAKIPLLILNNSSSVKRPRFFTNYPIRQSELYAAIASAIYGTSYPNSTPIHGPQLTVTSKRTLSKNHHILVVDDSDINLKVATKMLDVLGYRFATAGNGEEALRLLQEQAFDLVLMDIKMPKMGGIETTKAIRSCTSISKSLKIVALTASTFNEDKQRYLAAGMDDFIAKPIDLQSLEAVLANHLVEDTKDNSSPAASVSDFCDSYFNRTTIDRLKNLGQGNDDFLIEIFTMFKKEAPGPIHAIKSAIEHQEVSAAVEAAYRLKGLCQHIGADRLAVCVQQLEMEAAKSKFNQSELNRYWRKVLGSYRATCKEIDQWLARQKAA